VGDVDIDDGDIEDALVSPGTAASGASTAA
jgi:hypothetical protein